MAVIKRLYAAPKATAKAMKNRGHKLLSLRGKI